MFKKWMCIAVVAGFCGALIGGCSSAEAADSIDLSGDWQFKLGRSADEKTLAPPQSALAVPSSLDDTIKLPGTTDLNRKGQKTTGSTQGTYTRRYRHVGRAWYQRTIVVPQQWRQRDIELFIERALWKTTVYLDGELQGDCDSLATPHVYTLKNVTPGEHTLTICVDNSMIHNIGDKSHSYSENMQTIWNGMLGRLELRVLPTVQINAVRSIVNPDGPDTGELVVIVENSGQEASGSIHAVFSGEGSTGSISQTGVTLKPGVQTIRCELPKDLKRWDEFLPNLYDATITVQAGQSRDQWHLKMGFCSVASDGTFVTVNGRPTYLRGNLDNCHFPLTGHPPMDKAGWRRVWDIYRQFGLNRVRFHSWCPPEAAFSAADEVGLYLQVEAGVWIDGWMRGRVPSKPEGISDKNPSVRDFVGREMKRIIDAYGHHPSFVMFCTGNELGSSDFTVLSRLIEQAREYDGTGRLFSCSTARKLLETDDYYVSHQNSAGAMRGLRGPKTDWSYDAVKRGAPKTPLILHELGQWPIYPTRSEIDKYTGVVEARNLQMFSEKAAQNHLAEQDTAFQRATGKFSTLLYKAEMEAALRSKTYAGFDLLGLQDYMGQGEAMIGILDMFYDLKPGTITPQQYRQFCSPVVPLAQFSKYIWLSGQTLQAKIQVSNFSAGPVNRPVQWRLVNDKKTVIQKGEFASQEIPQGTVTDIGDLSIDLKTEIPLGCKLEVAIEGTDFQNSWPIWIYPETPKTDVPLSVEMVKSLDEAQLKRLQAGGTVLLMASGCMNKSNSHSNTFMPVYWSQGWFPGQAKTLGLLCDPEHSLFEQFPNEGYCDWQWWDIVNNSPAMILNDLPADFLPLVQPVDDFHYNRKLGTIFEGRVGEGRLLVCVYPLLERQDKPACRQLYAALLEYASDDKFQPERTIPVEWLKNNFKPQGKAEVSGQNPIGSETAALWVQVADKAAQAKKNIVYQPALDVVKTSGDGYGYKLSADGAWKDEGGCFVFGKKLSLTITLPKGVQGQLHVRFNDWNRNRRSGELNFENRETTLGDHTGDKGKWVKFNVMREDALDNMLRLQADVTSGPNLQIDEFVFIPKK